MKQLIYKITILCFIFNSALLSNTQEKTHSNVLYNSYHAKLEIAKRPLKPKAVDITLKKNLDFNKLDKQQFSDIWEARFVAESHLDEQGYKNRLCYSKITSKTPPIWQVISYPSLPWYLNNFLFKKIYSLSSQAIVLFKTIFPPSIKSNSTFNKEKAFWLPLNKEVNHPEKQKSGSGALIRNDVIEKQLIFPRTVSNDANEMLILYNYAPLNTGGEQMHFLVTAPPGNPAKNFLELDKQQYIKVLLLTKGITQWAENTFGDQATIHFFDKTGPIAGQNQPIYHAHIIITVEKNEEKRGKLAMFCRMILPPRPLAREELEKRVKHYRATVGEFLITQER